MFCACSTDYDGAPPNSHVCPVCLGLPGALPTINRRAVEHVLATGLAIEATTPRGDPLGSQELLLPGPAQGLPDQPVRPAARVGGPADLRHLRRAVHRGDHPRPPRGGHGQAHPRARTPTGSKVSLVDFNRSGAPLMEIVTEPDIRTAEQARRYAEELQLLLRSIGASDADMERGQMRVEANVSLRPRGTEPFGTRVEVKNMNSFRSVERAIAYEIERQAAALDAGEHAPPGDPRLGRRPRRTYRMRVKETSDDYRYFPEPDLPPLHVDAGLAGRDPGRAARAAGRPARRAIATRSGLSPLRRGRPRRRSGRDGAVRGDAGGRSRSRPRSRSRTG